MKKTLSIILSAVILISTMFLSNFNSYALTSKEDAKEIKLNQSIKISYDAQSADEENYISYVAKFTAPETKYYEFAITSRINRNVYICVETSDKFINGNYFYEDYSEENPFIAVKLTKGTQYYVGVYSYGDDEFEIYRSFTADFKVSEHSHSIIKGTTPADTQYDYEFLPPNCAPQDEPHYRDGKEFKECTRCNYYKTISTISPAKTVKLNQKVFSFDGKVKKPTVVVKDKNGKVIPSSEYKIKYTVESCIPVNQNVKASNQPIHVGDASVTVVFNGKKYAGAIRLPYKIIPKSTSLTKLTPIKGGFKAYWKEQPRETTGYQIRYSTKSNMQNAKTVTFYYNTICNATITNRLKGKKYYVQVRTIHNTVNFNSGKWYYSNWSKAMSVTTKK